MARPQAWASYVDRVADIGYWYLVKVVGSTKASAESGCLVACIAGDREGADGVALKNVHLSSGLAEGWKRNACRVFR